MPIPFGEFGQRHSRLNQIKAVAPNEEDVERGTKLFCQIDQGRCRSGTLRNEQGIIRWRYSFHKNADGRSWKNPFKKPDFVIADSGAKMELIIRRASFIPPVFDIRLAESVIGKIKMRSPFRNRYSIEIDGAGAWMFQMPLFTIAFYGSPVGAQISGLELGPLRGNGAFS
jgi:hypothetical protein